MVTLEQLQDGIVLPIDKPRQWTSFQAVNKVKAVVRNTYDLKKFKIGHAGTLDPLATGLLLICVGKATKTIPTLQDGDKVYTGTMVFGATTPCYDLERPIDSYYPYDHITPELLQQTLPQFTGTILQVPPMFSAVKIAGQRAYQYARTDDPTVVIQPKPVNVYSFEITAFRLGGPVDDEPTPQQPDNSQLSTPNSQLYKNPLGTVPAHLPQADFRIHCGKGTYIRSLARDLGLALGSGAFLSALRREQIGTYSVADALQLDEVEAYLTQ
jgi:tRNA pseudouridine55 synthase